ncbi:MAG: hypothetical protein QME79_12380 [Bacillota bacterium]|nr:hypothetical protein [Bacillota bacterium]
MAVTLQQLGLDPSALSAWSGTSVHEDGTIERLPAWCLREKAPDYRVLATRTEEYYEGPDGPFTRRVAIRVHAFGHEWIREDRWLDKARDIREVYFRIGPSNQPRVSVSKAAVLRAAREMAESGLVNSGALVQLNPEDLTIEVVEASAASHVSPPYPLSAEAPRVYGDYGDHDAEDAWLEWVAGVLHAGIPQYFRPRREWLSACAGIIARTLRDRSKIEEEVAAL